MANDLSSDLRDFANEVRFRLPNLLIVMDRYVYSDPCQRQKITGDGKMMVSLLFSRYERFDFISTAMLEPKLIPGY